MHSEGLSTVQGGGAERSRGNVVGIVVTYNPDEELLRRNLERAVEEARRVIVVDNGSRNYQAIRALCEKLGCDFIELHFNYGIVYALKKGVELAITSYSPSWILFLDQDSVLEKGAIEEAMAFYESLKEPLRSKVGILELGFRDLGLPYRAVEVVYGAFSGTLIRTDLLKAINFRVNFIMDQADFDLYWEVRRRGFLTLLIPRKLLHHRIGRPERNTAMYKIKLLLFKLVKGLGLRNLGGDWIPGNVLPETIYEPPLRYYYIVRNSVILLKEKKKDFLTFFKDLVFLGLACIYFGVFREALKALGLGFFHGLLKEEGLIKPWLLSS